MGDDNDDHEVESGQEGVENIYQALDKELDQGVTEGGDSDSDCENESTPKSNIAADLPPPRGGCQNYAFHEIKDMLTMREGLSDDIDLKKIAAKHSLKYDESQEFLAFSLLKSYVSSLDK